MESLEEIRSRHTFDCVTILNFPPNLFLILPLSPTLSRSLAWFHPFSFYSFDHSTSLVSRYTRIRRTTSIAAELYRSLKRFLRKRTRCWSGLIIAWYVSINRPPLPTVLPRSTHRDKAHTSSNVFKKILPSSLYSCDSQQVRPSRSIRTKRSPADSYLNTPHVIYLKINGYSV